LYVVNLPYRQIWFVVVFTCQLSLQIICSLFALSLMVVGLAGCQLFLQGWKDFRHD